MPKIRLVFGLNICSSLFVQRRSLQHTRFNFKLLSYPFTFLTNRCGKFKWKHFFCWFDLVFVLYGPQGNKFPFLQTNIRNATVTARALQWLGFHIFWPKFRNNFLQPSRCRFVNNSPIVDVLTLTPNASLLFFFSPKFNNFVCNLWNMHQFRGKVLEENIRIATKLVVNWIHFLIISFILLTENVLSVLSVVNVVVICAAWCCTTKYWMLFFYY